MAADSTHRKEHNMNNRMIGIIATLDENGLHEIGNQVPWGNIPGKTAFRYDNERFHIIARMMAPAGKRNVVVTDHETAKAMVMYPFEGCRTIVLARNLNLNRINYGRREDKVIYTARNPEQALDLALSWKNCGHVLFAGVGFGAVSHMLRTKLCNCAFVTVVKCDTFARSPFKDEPFHARFMLDDAAFLGMERTTTSLVDDMWDDEPVELEFRNYEKV